MATSTRPADKASRAPRTPADKASRAPKTPEGTTAQASLQQHLVTLAEGEVLDPQGLYEFCEALRAISSGLSFFVHTAASQLDRAVRKGARDSADGRLTLSQKAKLKVVLRRIARKLDSGAAEDLLAAASSAVQAYGLLEDFLEEIESENVDRPHRSSRGGFSLNRS